ncbi:hypothetical protein [Halomonas mongoliensis]|uniref:hypothetical protein n=1 Tax=Halomonas mongoliensis TaxID=321265 RepID=UPI00403AE801
MSEYQYYEFLTVDQPLSDEDQQALRAISSRARITRNSFTNHYHWGDLKAIPSQLLLRYFDLHVYVANWGSRELLIRLPPSALSDEDLAPFHLGDSDWFTVRQTPKGWLIEIGIHDEDDSHWEEIGDGSGWMGALAGLRQELLAGDLRLFYLCWLWRVQAGEVNDESLEPLPGIRPLTASQEALAEFIGLDPMLLEAAAECGPGAPSGVDREAFIAALPAAEKDTLLLRLLAGESDVGAELQRRLQRQLAVEPALHRSVAELRTAANASHERHRQVYLAEKAQREAGRQAVEARARQQRIERVARMGERAWEEALSEIASRKPKGYEVAANLLRDLQGLAEERGELSAFQARLERIVAEHRRKGRFLEQLERVGVLPPE